MGTRELKSVNHWLGRVSEATGDNYLVYFEIFLGFLENEGFTSDPDELVKFQAEHHDFQILDLVQKWVSGLDLRAGTKNFAYACVRSFFLHNRVSLPRDASFKIRSNNGRVLSSLKLDELRQIILSSNECYRALFLSMVMGGMGIGEVLHWSANGWSELLEQLDRGDEYISIDLPGRKAGRNIRPFSTLLGRDAKDALKIWIQKRGRDDGHIFLNQYDGSLNPEAIRFYWIRKLRRLGIVKDYTPEERGDLNKRRAYRTGKNVHLLRRVFRTRWQKSGAEGIVAEFMMGHIVDPLGYNEATSDPKYLIKEYRTAEPWLNILSQDPETVPRDTIEQMEKELTLLRDQVQEMQPAAERMEAFRVLMENPETREILLDVTEKLKRIVE